MQATIGQVADETLDPLMLDIRRSIEHKGGKFDCNFGRPYHTLQQGGGFKFALSSEEPVHSVTETTPIVGVSDNRDDRFAFIVIDANRPKSPPQLLRTDDLHPATTASADERIRSWVSETLRTALADMQRGIEQSLRGRGFTGQPVQDPVPVARPGPMGTVLLDYGLPRVDNEFNATRATNLAKAQGL